MAVHLLERDWRKPGRATVERASWLEAATVAVGVALAVLVGVEGSRAWQAVRVLGVAAIASLLVVVELRADRRARGRVGVAVGIVAITVALGFSPYLVKGGPVAVRLATVLLGTAGLVLTVGGTMAATQGHRRLRRFGTSAAVLIAVVLAAFVISPAVAATNVPRPAVGATPESVGLRYEIVWLETTDGVRLAGWYVPSTKGAAVVLLHGAGSTRSNVLPQAAVLARHGFGVLMVDARGHGDSGGQAMDFGWDGDADVAAATAYLATRPDVRPGQIGAVGLSMGGEEAIGATRSNGVLRAVVAEGATGRMAGDDAWLSDRHGLRGAFQEQLERVQDWVTDVLTSASVPSSLHGAVHASGRARYLLITAGNVSNERNAADYVATAAPERVEVWTVEGANHTAGLRTAPEEWEGRVTTFLDEVLLSARR
jgi:pimeloyl-ACP methyl ester carboxylesterase